MSFFSLLAQAATPATTAPMAPSWVQFLNSGIMPIILVLIVLFLPKGIWDPARFRHLFGQWFGRAGRQA